MKRKNENRKKRRRNKLMMDLTQKEWVKHSVTHPFEGFEDMRWQKAGSLKTAFLIVLAFFVGTVLYQRNFGLQFAAVNDKLFNIVPYFIRSVVLFATWVIGNWAVCTLLDGEGTMKNICIYSAYSLIPYIAMLFIILILSHILIQDEIVFIVVIRYIGTGWTALLLFSAIKSVHQYSVGKTIFAILLTIAAMLIMLFLLVLFMSLIQQVYIFISTIYTEITYRLRV